MNNWPVRCGDRLLLAVSGGPDSMVMLHQALQLRQQIGCVLFAVHVDHQFRPESSQEQLMVSQYCQEHQVPIYTFQLEQPSAGENIEAYFHQERYKIFNRLIKQLTIDYLVLGHHADDRAETFLMHLLRGSGWRGLSSMPLKKDGILRPLLAFTKKEIMDYTAKHHIPYALDKTNEDNQYYRNQIRHELIPYLTEIEPHAVKQINNAASHIEELRSYIESEAKILLSQSSVEDHAITIQKELLVGKHPALLKEYLMQCIFILAPHVRSLARPALERFVSSLKKGKTCQVPIGFNYFVLIDQKMVCIKLMDDIQKEASIGPFCYLWDLENKIHLPLDSGVLVLESPAVSSENIVLQGHGEPCNLEVRTRMPGDRIKLTGIGHKKLKKIYQELKLSPQERSLCPIIVKNGFLKSLPLLNLEAPDAVKVTDPDWQIILIEPELQKEWRNP